MLKKLRQAVPSMFHRRLLLLTCSVLMICGLLFAQLFRLSIVQGDDRLTDAMARLERRTFLPTYRGRILDRYGRELARDVASYHICVRFSVITELWSQEKAYKKALADYGTDWKAMGPEQRGAAIEYRRGEFDAVIEAFWEDFRTLGGIDREELDRRLDAIKHKVDRMTWKAHDRQLTEYEQKFGSAAASLCSITDTSQLKFFLKSFRDTNHHIVD